MCLISRMCCAGVRHVAWRWCVTFGGVSCCFGVPQCVLCALCYWLLIVVPWWPVLFRDGSCYTGVSCCVLAQRGFY